MKFDYLQGRYYAYGGVSLLALGVKTFRLSGVKILHRKGSASVWISGLASQLGFWRFALTRYPPTAPMSTLMTEETPPK
jgi:hypothetical protein